MLLSPSDLRLILIRNRSMPAINFRGAPTRTVPLIYIVACKHGCCKHLSALFAFATQFCLADELAAMFLFRRTPGAKNPSTPLAFEAE